MHECPECGHDCTCHGDFDDCPVMTDDWVWNSCTHCDDASDLRDDDEDCGEDAGRVVDFDDEEADDGC